MPQEAVAAARELVTRTNFVMLQGRYSFRPQIARSATTWSRLVRGVPHSKATVPTSHFQMKARHWSLPSDAEKEYRAKRPKM